MKAGPLLLFLALGAIPVFVSNGPCAETDEKGFIEFVTPYGYINWTTGTVFANGYQGSSDADGQNPAPDCPTSQPAQDLRSRLFNAVQKVRISSSGFVKDLIQQNEMLQNQLQGLVGKAKMVKQAAEGNHAAETTLAFIMTGGFAQLALPQEIKPVPEIRTLSGKNEKNREKDPSTDRLIHSGVVFDAQGLHGVPALAPRITNENGEEVYGPTYVSREFVVQHGMAAFETDLQAGTSNPRVGDNPLVVRCLKTTGEMPCDFIISNADASRIRGRSDNLKLLKKCNVVIVLDEKIESF